MRYYRQTIVIFIHIITTNGVKPRKTLNPHDNKIVLNNWFLQSYVVIKFLYKNRISL